MLDFSEAVLLVLIFVFGSIVFGFLNVVIYRLPRGENFITGRSKCASCGHELSFVDMAPILSRAALGGKCRYCGERIFARCALIDALGGAAAVGCAVLFGLSIYTVLAFAMCGILVCVGSIDYDTMEIPDVLNIAAAVVGVLSMLLTDHAVWYDHLLGMFVISVPMLIIAVVIPGAFGGGDIKLMAGCGLFLGWVNAVFAFAAGVVIGGVWALVLIVRGKKGRKDKIAFGPSLCLGVAFAIFAHFSFL